VGNLLWFFIYFGFIKEGNWRKKKKKKKKEEKVNLPFMPSSFTSSLILCIRSVEKRRPLPNVNMTRDSKSRKDYFSLLLLSIIIIIIITITITTIILDVFLDILGVSSFPVI
jgi:hypothetical protein